MTRLNLAQTCLLDVSGELGKKAKDQLDEHVRQYPAALIEHQLVKAQFEMLRSLPQVQMTDEQKKAMASAIKQGVHRKLRKQEAAVRAAKRMQYVHYALAAVSGMAACLMLGAGVVMMQRNHDRQLAQVAERTRQANQADAVLVRYRDADRPNMYDWQMGRVDEQINEAEQWKPEGLVTSDSPRGAAKLLDDLDAVLDQQPMTPIPDAL